MSQRKIKPTTPSPAKPAKSADLLVADTLAEAPAFFANTGLQSLLLFAFAFLLYANTLTHQWAQDDAIVITDNMFTQKGIAGIKDIFAKDTFYGFFKEEGKASLVSGGRYRPLTLAFFAVVYQVAGKNPFAFHFLTVMLFAFTCVLLYQMLLLLFNNYRGNGYGAVLAWMATVLFIAHPVHTEVVDNVKGCDEIVTLLGSLAALFFSLKAFDSGKFGLWSIAAAVTFFLGLLAKENAVTFLAVVPLALIFFRNASIGGAIRHTTPLLAAFVVFFAIRSSVLPALFAAEPMELMNNPYLKVEGNLWVKFTAGERYATIIYTLGRYLQLLFLPHPLTHDYYPRHVDIMSFAKPTVLASLILYVFLAWYAISGLLKGQRDVVRFGILFYLLTLSIVSNLVFPIGTNMGERFLFMPSIGFCLVIAALLMTLWQQTGGLAVDKMKMPLAVLGVATALFALKTVTRNPVWHDDKTLFFTDVKTSVNSAKLQNACGGTCCTEAGLEKDEAKQADLYRRAIGYLSKALQIHPTYKDALLNRGISYFHLKDFEKAIADFKQADFVAPNDPKGKKNLAVAYRDGGKYYGEVKHDLNTALKYLNESLKIAPDDRETLRLLGVANGVGGNHPEAIKWFTKLTELEPANAASWYDLSVAYGVAGNAAKMNEFRAKALQINPNIAEERKQQK